MVSITAQKIKKTLKDIIGKFLFQKVIVFESVPDLSDNTMCVFEELVRRGYNKKYIFVWICMDDYGDYKRIKNVFYLNRIVHPRISKYIINNAKASICCNRFTGSRKEGQHNFYLCHGTPLKYVRNYFNAPKYINHIIASSEYMVSIVADQLKVSEKIIEPLGFPRNDVLFNKAIDLKLLFGNYNKFVVWYPTFKKSKGGLTTNCSHSIQFVWDDEYAKEINDTLVKNNMLLIIKHHFAQIEESEEIRNYSNIKYIDDKFFAYKGITSYEMVSGSDALLTDYSSIYSDYLLCNKPVGLIWQDIDEFLKNPGLIKEYQFICSGGTKIYTCSELCDFLDDVNNNRDALQKNRNDLLPYIHCSKLPDNTSRVTDYIVNTISL